MEGFRDGNTGGDLSGRFSLLATEARPSISRRVSQILGSSRVAAPSIAAAQSLENPAISTYIEGEQTDGPMQTIEAILEAARRLSEGERRRLVEALQGNAREAPIEEQRRDALSSWLGLAGTFHSDFTDVSTEKYKHLPDVYADER